MPSAKITVVLSGTMEFDATADETPQQSLDRYLRGLRAAMLEDMNEPGAPEDFQVEARGELCP